MSYFTFSVLAIVCLLDCYSSFYVEVLQFMKFCRHFSSHLLQIFIQATECVVLYTMSSAFMCVLLD